MHEFSVVEQLVDRLLSELRDKGITSVREVHLRRGSTFAEAPLRQAFEILKQNTPLQNAALVIDEFSVTFSCRSCGHAQHITADDLIGHMFICPECGVAKEIEEAHGLEFLGADY